jgi:hypothetical protein
VATAVGEGRGGDLIHRRRRDGDWRVLCVWPWSRVFSDPGDTFPSRGLPNTLTRAFPYTGTFRLLYSDPPLVPDDIYSDQP